MYKTKIIAGIAVVWAIVGLILGELDPVSAWQMVLTGAGAFSLRDAIK